MTSRRRPAGSPWLTRAFRCACRLYPESFRRAFGDDMLHSLTAEVSARRRERGRLHATFHALRTLLAMAAGAIAHRTAARRDRSTPSLSRRRPPVATALGELLRDVTFGVRTLRRTPGATAAMLIALALGAGAATAIFSVVNGVWLKALPYPDADRIVVISEVTRRGRETLVTTPSFYDWREGARSFAAVAVHTPVEYPGPRVVLGGNQPVRALVTGVSSRFLDVLGVRPRIGRPFTAAEHAAGGPPVALVSHDYWRLHLGGAADLSGRALTIDDTTYGIVGVLPPGFHYPADSDVWIPWRPYDPGRNNHNWVAVARIRAGVTFEQARRETSAITRRLHEQLGDSMSAVDARAVHLREALAGSTRRPLRLLLGAAILLLLVANANVASVQLARAVARLPELAIRTALGAGRGRLVRQILTESLVLAVAGTGVGLVAGRGLMRGLLRAAPEDIASTSLGPDHRVALFALLVALGSAVASGLLPAWRGTRARTGALLRARGRGATAHNRRTWQAMVVVEVAAAVVLLVGAGLLSRSFQRMAAVQPGFNSTDVLTVDMALPESIYPNDATKVLLFEPLLARLRELPGARTAGLMNTLPLVGTGTMSGSLETEAGRSGSASYRVVDQRYFEALDIPLVRGRLFDERDRAGAPHVALVNASLAAELWPGEDPVGRQIGNFGNDNRAYRGIWATVIGVVADVRDAGLAVAPTPTVFVHVLQRPLRTEQLSLVVRRRPGAHGVADQVREVIAEIAPDVPVELADLDVRVARLAASRRFLMLVVGVFAAAALALATVGIYGVVSHGLTRRRRELGIRVALGASPAGLYRLVVGASLRDVLVGGIVGAAVAMASGRLLASLLFQISPADPATYGAVAVVLAAAGGIASFLPAHRGVRIDPIVTLRAD